MYTLDRQDPPQLMARARPWWQFTILAVIAFACVSCSDVAHQTPHPWGGAVQHPHITEAARLPLTDSAPPQGDMAPTISVPQLHSTLTIATPIPTPTPKISWDCQYDDQLEGWGQYDQVL